MSDHRLKSSYFTGIIYLIIIIVISLCMAGCGTDERTDPRLVRIAEMDSPMSSKALDSLKTIDKSTLSESDHHYYDFLTVKVSDKCYIKHTSDSLIKDVTAYYSSLDNSPLYPEVLYYNGRVYRDLGDNPTALSYFHKAVEIIPKDKNNFTLLGNIYSQMSSLFLQFRLYKDAETYMEKAVDMDIQNNDSLNLLYDFESMAHIKIQVNKYDEALHYLKAALKLAKNQPDQRENNLKRHLAGLYNERGQTDSALIYIRHLPELLDGTARYLALSYAADIYLKAGILDTAYQYAYTLAHSSSRNRRNGFNILLCTEISRSLPLDSIIKFTEEYHAAVEEYLNQNESEEISIQNSKYNYNLHLIERNLAERRNLQMTNWLGGLFIIALLLTIIFIYRQNLYQKKLLQLHMALDKARKLKGLLRKKGIIIDEETYEEIGHESNLPDSVTQITATLLNRKESEKDLRKELRNILLSMADDSTSVPFGILNSPAYLKVKQYIKDGKGIDDNNSFWEELEEAVALSSPDFKPNLTLLTNGKMTRYEFNIALLIKCGFSPTEMAQLLNKTLSTIGSRRESLGYKIFDKKTSVKVVDKLIRSL